MGFVGGSAYGMAREIGEGYHLVTERTFKKLLPSELDQLGFELDRRLRDLRGQKTPLDDAKALQKRNRRLQRLNGVLIMLNGYRQRTRRPR